MNYVEFTDVPHGLNLPQIGIGTIGAGPVTTATSDSIRKRIDLFAQACDLGANFFDTGEDYEEGHAEIVLGQFAKNRRHELIIASKFAPNHASEGQIVRAAENSLRRLGTDYIDIYQMHWPNSDVALDEMMRGLERLVSDGKVRYIGVGNCSLKFARQAQDCLQRGRLVSTQFKFNALDRPTLVEPNFFEALVEADCAGLGYGLFGQGHLSLGVEALRTVDRLCAKYEISKNQLLIAWALTFPRMCTLIRSMNPAHLRSNILAAEVQLDPVDVHLLSDCFQVEVRQIQVSDIRVLDSDADPTHKIYLNLVEALANRYDMRPSVQTLAAEIEDGEPFRPVGVVARDGRYELIQGRMRFWAWCLLHGEQSTIPCIVMSSG